MTEAVGKKLQCFENAAAFSPLPQSSKRSGEKAAMFRERGEPYEHSIVFERRHPIADGFRGLPRHNRLNRRADLLQGAARGFRDGREVFVYILWGCAAFFHASMSFEFWV